MTDGQVRSPCNSGTRVLSGPGTGVAGWAREVVLESWEMKAAELLPLD